MNAVAARETARHADEAERLGGIAADSWYGRGANAEMVKYSARVFARHWHGQRCLELGPAEGHMTAVLVESFADLTVVDGAETFCDVLRARHPGVTVVHSLFEAYEPVGTFDTIIVGHVLEHVNAPVELLARIATWLAPGGSVLAAVPNALSLHRRAAVLMDLLPDVHAFSEQDIHHGHRRVYDPAALREDVVAAGLRIDLLGGYWLKPVSNAQIEATWSPEMLRAFMELGESFPDIAAETYVVAGI